MYSILKSWYIWFNNTTSFIWYLFQYSDLLVLLETELSFQFHRHPSLAWTRSLLLNIISTPLHILNICVCVRLYIEYMCVRLWGECLCVIVTHLFTCMNMYVCVCGYILNICMCVRLYVEYMCVCSVIYWIYWCTVIYRIYVYVRLYIE